MGRTSLIAAALLLAASVNPYVEHLQYQNPIPFMLSHYALFAAGLLLGRSYLRLPGWFLAMGAAVAVYWHLPGPFAASSSLFPYRAVEELSMVAGGVLAGGARVGARVEQASFALWVAGDTALSVVFISWPAPYSIPPSSFSPQEFPLTGVAMILLMNLIVAFVIYAYLRRMYARVEAG